LISSQSYAVTPSDPGAVSVAAFPFIPLTVRAQDNSQNNLTDLKAQMQEGLLRVLGAFFAALTDRSVFSMN
jgi:hypothetical protein